MRWLAATISLKVSAILPSIPRWSPLMRTEKLPPRISWSAWRRSCKESGFPLVPVPPLDLRRGVEGTTGARSLMISPRQLRSSSEPRILTIKSAAQRQIKQEQLALKTQPVPHAGLSEQIHERAICSQQNIVTRGSSDMRADSSVGVRHRTIRTQSRIPNRPPGEQQDWGGRVAGLARNPPRATNSAPKFEFVKYTSRHTGPLFGARSRAGEGAPKRR